MNIFKTSSYPQNSMGKFCFKAIFSFNYISTDWNIILADTETMEGDSDDRKETLNL